MTKFRVSLHNIINAKAPVQNTSSKKTEPEHSLNEEIGSYSSSKAHLSGYVDGQKKGLFWIRFYCHCSRV